MDKIRQRAKNDLTLAEQNEKALRLAFEAQKSVTSKMNDDVVQLGILMEQANSSRELYDLLFAKLQEANIDSGSSAANVTIADPARPPGRPFVPQRGLAYLLESQDDTLADSVQVESLAHAPVLAVIPYHRRQTRSGRDAALDAETSPFLTDRDGATAEAIRTLRSALTLSGDVVRALRFHAKAYIHGHRVGGTNPSLVESLAAGSATIAHDNRFTRWVAGEEAKFFTGPEDLEEIVCSLEKEPKLLEEMEAGSRQRFEKDLVKDRVLAAYEELLLRVSRCYRKGPPDSGAAWLPRFMRRRYTARRNRWDDGDAKE
jgi:glycosyltransferase involved in cell wall biosynthesis